MKYILVFILQIISAVSSFAQPTIDTGKLMLNSKLLFTEFIQEYEDKDYYEHYINSYIPDVIYLSDSGFDNRFVFYKIKISKHFGFKKQNDTLIVNKYYFKDYDGYVFFAFDAIAERIYRIGGFKNNDIYSFIKFLKSYYGGINAINLKCKNINKYFWIENIDIKCLCKSIAKCKYCTPPIFPNIDRYNTY